VIGGRDPAYGGGIKVRAAGSWSPCPPPYLLGISDRDFVRLKEEWLKRVMMIGALVPSYRVIAYFMADSLNWATMDGWRSHQTLADLVGTSPKTVQRTTMLTEEKSLMAVYRRDGRRQPLRYAPMYLVASTLDSVVERSEHRCPAGMDTDVHQSFLGIQLESSEEEGLPKEHYEGVSVPKPLSFNLAERGRVETELATILGGFDVLLRLAAIHDDIITRLCEAHVTGHLGHRQIKAGKLAAKQTHAG
jgi:hypothetical protein